MQETEVFGDVDAAVLSCFNGVRISANLRCSCLLIVAVIDRVSRCGAQWCLKNTCCHGCGVSHLCYYGYPLCIAFSSARISGTVSAATPAKPRPLQDSGDPHGPIKKRCLLMVRWVNWIKLNGLIKLWPGFRYRCMRCVNVHVCQSCFLTDKHTRKHKLHHPVLEFCTQVSPHHYCLASSSTSNHLSLALKNHA